MQNSRLADYSKILAISQQMAELAKAENWDALAASECERAALIQKAPGHVANLPANEAQHLAGVISEIMTLDATVREHVAPWMEQVATLLPALAPKS